ncbi:hypothetical protein KVR01_012364 [Diaporthe batatas]|uniref:uncharacterized protein n=1 Tax=Diaporthe batatas TaxID=748121 RepID=UPI001D0416FF|nr:uncharacterized protein KVR01_012364 [Diaporthe batatas]KAG8157702.1 hypothetical protein KVR01_012364 [Diaporthe batatas]
MASTYHRMIIESNEVPVIYNMMAAAASWTMLAGFFVLPGTFTSLEGSEYLQKSQQGQAVQKVVQNITLLPMAAMCCTMSAGGLYFLWSRFRNNYVWILTHLLL